MLLITDRNLRRFQSPFCEPTQHETQEYDCLPDAIGQPFRGNRSRRYRSDGYTRSKSADRFLILQALKRKSVVANQSEIDMTLRPDFRSLIAAFALLPLATSQAQEVGRNFSIAAVLTHENAFNEAQDVELQG